MKKKFLVLIIFALFNINSEISQVQAKEKKGKIRACTLANAIQKGKINEVRNYLEAGVDPNKSCGGSTPLVFAIQNEQYEIMDYLLLNGANPNIKKGVPPLHYAVIKNNKYAVAKLLKSRADIEKIYINTSAKELANAKKYSEIEQIFIDFEKDGTKFNPEEYKPFKELTKNSKKQVLSAKVNYTLEKKDTNLIKITNTRVVNKKKLSQKLLTDKKEYQKIKRQLTEEQYSLVRILDKLLRANNLQYQNWRIGIDIDTKNINAQASSANLITINSSLYDSLYQEEDALAFVVAHELAHLVLDHVQIGLENSIKIQNLEYQVRQMNAAAQRENYLGSINSAVGNHYSAMGNSASALAYSIAVASLNAEINRVYTQERTLEIDADTEALIFMTRAGYNPEKAALTLELLSEVPNIYTSRSTHPDHSTRKSYYDENIFLNDNNELKKQGDINIMNSKVLKIKKSSDKKTVILSKEPKFKKYKYTPVSREEKIIKKAYIYYLKNDIVNAENLFSIAYNINSSNYIPPLYLSYINEYKFIQKNNKKDLKRAKYWAKKARNNMPNNKFTEQQKKDIKNLYSEIKINKKALKLQKRTKKAENKEKS